MFFELYKNFIGLGIRRFGVKINCVVLDSDDYGWVFRF